MRTIRLPVTTQYNTRSGVKNTDTTSGIIGVGIIGQMIIGKTVTFAQKDSGMVNCFTQTAAGKKYTVKRPGWTTLNTPAVGQAGYAILVWTGNSTGDKVITAFGSPSTIYDGATSLGLISGACTGISETFTGNNIATILMSANDQSGWYMPANAITAPGTGNTTIASAIVNTIASTTGLYTGQAISGAGIPASTRILTVDSATQITMTQNATATTAGVVLTTEKIAKIIDVDFPGNAAQVLVGTFVTIDGYAVIMTANGRVWSSDLNTLSGWTASSYDSANAYPDAGIGAVRYKNMIVAFGTESLQLFYNAGLTPFPFAKSISQTLKIGAVAAGAITNISDTIFFAGSTPQGGISIYKYDGSLARVSTPEIDTFLLLNGSSGINLTSIRYLGRSFIYINTGSYTLVYCLEENRWHELAGTNKLWGKCVGASVGALLYNYCISTSFSSGKVYKMDQTNFTYLDDGAAIQSKINLPNWDGGTNKKKFFSSIEIIADTETSSSPVDISYSDDDFVTFKILGTVDLSSQRKRLTRAGAGRKRAFQLTTSANTPFRIEALELTIEVGLS